MNTEAFTSGLARLETKLRKSRIDTIDTIVAPTAGFLTEFLAKKFNIKNIVYYDLTQDHLDYKKEINIGIIRVTPINIDMYITLLAVVYCIQI